MSMSDYRPIYHFTTKKNWINDPNGLVYYNGTYHMFFQYDPDSKAGNQKVWGHAVSTDFVNWTELDIALSNEDYEMFSGTACIDYSDTLGVKNGADDVMLLAYTAWQCGQCLAYSNDGGKTFHKIKENPVIPNYNQEDRDPKLFWHAESGKWVMIFYAVENIKNGIAGYTFFTSDNLIDWEYQSEVPGLYECPDFRQIQVDGTEEKKWVILCCNGDYYVGDFDGKRFIPEQALMTTWRNYRDYATQTWSNQPGDRITQMSWLVSDDRPELPYSQQMAFPVDLSLRLTDGKYILCKNPIGEIEKLYKKTYTFENLDLDWDNNPFDGIKGNAFDITYEIEADPKGWAVLYTPNGAVDYSGFMHSVRCHNMWEDLKPIGNTVKIRVLTDKSSLEVFADDGRLYMPFSVFNNGENTIRLAAKTRLIKATVNVIG